MSELFGEKQPKKDLNKVPLARRICPSNLDEFVGQEKILGKGKLLRRAIESDRISSLILYGPPGVGKNALANVIANQTSSYFVEVNAVLSGVEDIRKVISTAKERLIALNKRTIFFIDEIHRFNKLQQDALLPDVENGNVILVGATTQNPYFYINPALISRSLVIEFEPLTNEDLRKILLNAVSNKENGFGSFKINITEDALNHIINFADGDARIALNALEVGVLTSKPDENGVVQFDIKVAEDSIQKKKIVYDSDEDGHYNTISAFIKSMRGSDPDAALYYLAKMIYAGEDPRFIARRIVICASEDVGLADPQALVVANSALQVAEFIGMPEAKIPLAQATIYVACASKSNAGYIAINKAMEDVENKKTLETPKYLKETGYKGAKDLGHGVGYKYAHDYNEHYVKQDYIPEKKKYYEPTNQGYEAKIKEYLDKIKRDRL